MSEELLIQDGVKYSIWTPENEPADFEPMVKYHIKDIFGEEARYFPKQKLKTLANNSSIPDGFVIDFRNKKWYVVELKLLCDDAVRRISGQIVDYKNAMKNPLTRQQIFKSIYDELNKPELHEAMYDLIINKNPEIVVLLVDLTGEMGAQFKEKVEGVDGNVKISVFKTFAREGVDPKMIHVHMFESLNAKNHNQFIPPYQSEENTLSPSVTKFETTFTPSDINFICVRFSRKYRSLFPPHSVDFIVETNNGEIITCITGASQREIEQKGLDNAGSWFVKGIREWFRKNHIKTGDKVSIEVIEPKKRYKLEILK
ncbi:MAG: hypothetical protein WAX07_03795 [Candidatus Altiarchaeia archaeon]